MSAPLATQAGSRYLRALNCFTDSAFRLETRAVYDGSGEDAAFAAFLEGAPPPPLSSEDLDYLASVRRAIERDARWQRVHVLREPLTDYLRFELTWEYGPNVEAGEEIGLVVVEPDEGWPHDLPRDVDFTLIDDHLLFEQVYSDEGKWLGLEEVRNRARITQARHWRDAALRRAESWASYVTARPALVQRVPKMREAS